MSCEWACCTLLLLHQTHSNPISSASSLTIVRLVFVIHHNFAVNYLEGVAKVFIWGVIELGIGIIAGSMATLRPLLRHVPFLSNGSSSSGSKPQEQAPYRPGPCRTKATCANNAECCVEDDDVDQTPSEGGSQRHTLKEMLALTRVSSHSEC